MPLLEDFASDFGREVQARGREYFRRGAAQITDSGAEYIEASVRGGELYTAYVGWDELGEPEYDCSCRYFQDRGGPCKHLWAALLQAEKDGLLVDDLDQYEGDDDPDFVALTNRPAAPPPKRGRGPGGRDDAGARPSKAADTQWKRQLAKLRDDMRAAAVYERQPAAPAWQDNRRIIYVVDVPSTVEGTGLTIELAQETLKRDGRWDRAKSTRISREQTAGLPDPDRAIVQSLLGARRGDYGGGYYGFYGDTDTPRKFVLPESSYLTTFRQMVETGRCRLRYATGDNDVAPLAWDDGQPWEFWLDVKSSPGGRYYVLDGSLRRKGGPSENGAPSDNGSPDAEQRMAISEPHMLLRGGLLFAGGKVARFNHFDAFALVIGLRDGLKLTVPIDQHEELMRVLYSMPRLPKLDVPEALRLPESRPAPRPRLTVRRPSRSGYDDRLVAELSFEYGGQVVKAAQEAQAIVAAGGGRVIFRDVSAERIMLARLLALGFRESFDNPYSPSARSLRLPPTKLGKAVADLSAEGWHVEAEGKLYRQPGEFKVQVSSGIDWFE